MKVTSRLCYVFIAVVWLVNGIFTGISNVHTSQTGLLTGYLSVLCLTTVFIYLRAFVSIRQQRFLLLTDIAKSDTVKRMMELL